MYKRMKYLVKSCSMENPQNLQDLLNEMSMSGWELYSMQEDENDDGRLLCHCIFMKPDDNFASNSDVINISSFKSRMEKLFSPEQSPYSVCLDIQAKIRDRKHKISSIKKELEGEAPASIMRKKLNDKISAGLKELDDLKVELTKATSSDMLFDKLKEDKLSICLSEELLSYIDNDSGIIDEELVAEIVKSKSNLVEDIGYIVPKIVFKDDVSLNPYEFSIKVRGIDVFKAFVYPNYLMYYTDELHLENKIKDAIYDVDKITGRKIVWIERSKTKNYWCQGISGAQYIAKAFEYYVVKYVQDIFDYEDLEKYIDVVRQSNEFLVENLVTDSLTLTDIKLLLVSLIQERVSIKDIVYIFEKINDVVGDCEKAELLDRLRLALSRQICNRYKNSEGIISAFELSDESMIKISPFIFQEGADDENVSLEDSDVLAIDSQFVKKLCNKFNQKLKKDGVINPILVVPMEYRTLIYLVLEKKIDVTVLAKEEVQNNAQLDIIGKL